MNSSVYRSRLSGEATEQAARFMSSIKEDNRILVDDILGTMAHNLMLYERGIISHQDLKKILAALEELRTLWIQGKVELNQKFEDVHEFIEGYVLEKAGLDVGGKMHTGRSRNDQVALDQRLCLRRELNDISEKILDLIQALLERAAENCDSPMVGYTHTQHAQITTFSHYLLAYVDALFRDLERIRGCYSRINKSPLGSCALAGSSLPLDREMTARLLGFEGLVENSIDGVSSRDFAVEALACSAILMADLSRISEDLILWSSSEFGYVEVADAYSSTSSVMPHKKNPCTLELIRGKTGTVYGGLLGLLTSVKGLMTGYNRDLQEAKKILWTSIDTVKESLEILTPIFKTLKVNRDRMFEVASGSYAQAIDLAEELVGRGLSFREAHRLVGNIVRGLVESKRLLVSLSPEEIGEASQRILGKRVDMTLEDLERIFNPYTSISSRRTLGSPNPEEVNRMVRYRLKRLDDSKRDIKNEVERLERVWKDLLDMVNSIISR
ncbi:argininosuccinate lyase [Candidatus Bathyarchaeota archaeon]|nr:argininosuccinate lyase [Candidatus Bathyarchaeota archaeon]